MLDMKPRLGTSLSAIAVAAALAFAASGPASAAALRMMFQGNAYEIDAVSVAAKAFEVANPGKTIELIHMPHDSYNEKIGASRRATCPTSSS